MGYGNLEWLKLGYNLEFLPDAASFGLLSDIALGGGRCIERGPYFKELIEIACLMQQSSIDPRLQLCILWAKLWRGRPAQDPVFRKET